MNELMIDLETMSTERNARVIQAGWVAFDPFDTVVLSAHGDEMNVNSDSCVDGHVSHDTFMFWLRASDEARRSVARPGVSIKHALIAMFYHYQQYECQSVWSNGATFDIVIVEHWARHYRLEIPWKHYNHQDTRSVWRVAEGLGWKRERGETAHTGKADSIAQAQQLQKALRWIRYPQSRDL